MASNNVGQTESAWAYLVVSSEQQADTLDHQQSWVEETARASGWLITETFRGVSSGRDGTRGLLEELLVKLRKTPKVDRPRRVLMIRLDRIGRGIALEALAAIAEISRLGSIIHTRQDGDYALTRASDSILPLMRVVTGAIENEARRDKAKAVFDRRRAANKVVGNKRPYGLQLSGGIDVGREPQAKAVRYAFELASNGYGLAAIGERLRATAADKEYVNGRTHVTEWSNSRVSRMLSNPAYAGTIVDQALWDSVQYLRAQSPRTRTSTRHPWPLSGTVHCTCGRLLIGSILGSPPHRVYRCTTKTIHGKNVTVSAKRLERLFIELLTTLRAGPDLSHIAVDRHKAEADLARLQTEIDEIVLALRNREIERKRAWSMNQEALITDADLGRRLKQLDAETRDLNALQRAKSLERFRMEARQASAVRASEIIAQAAEIWTSADVAQQQTAAHALARALGGLYLEGGQLRIGPPPTPNRFKRATVLASSGS
jgi:DNA invertase Pin-like site-specific DNA recombinase